MSYSGIQFGGDKRLSDVMPLYVGLYIGSTHASPDYSGGDGTARSDYMECTPVTWHKTVFTAISL